MLDQAYELGVQDALEYIEKVAGKVKAKAIKKSLGKHVDELGAKVKDKASRFGGAVKREGKAAGGFAKRHKTMAGLGLGAAAGAGYGARKATED
jgi:hypothetical protein